MKLGIMQGRLSPPVDGKIQEFPKNWQREFGLLNMLGLNHIDWIVTNDDNNPLHSLSDNLKGLPINYICADNLIHKNFYQNDFLRDNIIPICKYALSNNIFSITIPLLDESNAEDDEKRKRFIENVLLIAYSYPEISFSFEAELSIEKLEEIVNSHPNFFITYDTGNCTSYGISHREFITKFINKISNVHLKDRNMKKQTMEPGFGAVDFEDIFGLLKFYNYSGPFTLQTARGESWKEIETIRRHIQFFKKIYESENF